MREIKRKREQEGGRDRERKREGERVSEKEGGREWVRKRDIYKDVEYGYFIFIFKRNDGCLGIF